MNIQHPSIEEQAKSLIAQTKFEFVCRVLNKTTLEVSDYDLVLTITRAEFLRYLQDNFTIESLVKTHTSQRDGFYALKNRNGWLTFGQERKIRFNERQVTTENEVFEQYTSVEIGL